MTEFLRLPELDDVLEMLWADGPSTTLLAGGTDLLVRPEPFGQPLVIDLTAVAGLGGVGLDKSGRLRIGALATHAEISNHPLVLRHARLLALACERVGSIQIRNRGTLGGNLAHASPAADSVPALLCLEAEVALRSRDRQRRLPVAEFFRGPGQTALAVDELIEAVYLPLRRGRTVAFFQKAGQRRGMCCAKATVAFVAQRHGDGRLTGVRIAMGAVAPTPIAVPKAAAVLEGRVLSPALIEEATRACSDAVRAIDDIRSTAAYRRRVVGALLAEGLLEILDHHHRLAARARSRARIRSRRR